MVQRPFEDISVPVDNVQEQEQWAGLWGRERFLLRAALWRSETLDLRLAWSDTGTQAQETQVHTNNNTAVEMRQSTTTQAHRQGRKDKV